MSGDPRRRVQDLTKRIMYVVLDYMRPDIDKPDDGKCVMDCTEAVEAALVADLDAVLGVPSEPSWRCFHCDEVFTDKAEAQEHFGLERDYSTSACRLTAEQVRELRALEQHNAELRAENDRLDNDARLWHEAEADRRRRIGNREWWQELDSREGEKLVLQEKVATLEAELALLRVLGVPHWQPIDSAPTTPQGEKSICYLVRVRGKYGVMVARRYDTGGWSSVPGYWRVHPTHWAPIPGELALLRVGGGDPQNEKEKDSMPNTRVERHPLVEHGDLPRPPL